jgi:aspartyl-tRNA(Asn)/glutamyl-tRNA(Gln) amidotransferase subunit B
MLVEKGVVSGSIAKTVFEKMLTTGREAPDIVAADGLAQIDDDAAIAKLVDEVLAANPAAVAQFRGGKTASFGFLVGQVMRAGKGQASPARVNALLKKALEAE